MSLETKIEENSDWEIWKDWIEQALDKYSKLDSESPERLTAAIRYSLLSPGKRLRPILVLAACDLCEGPVENAVAAACAVEMIHAYSLVHDDLPGMDDDCLRRGRPTCHVQFDHATAILAGDALQAMAFGLLADSYPDQRGAKAVSLLARAAGPCGMAGGQQDDLSASEFQPTKDLLDRIHRRKTGALLSVALEIGGLIADASSQQLGQLRIFGKNIGLAFQITDDLLDVKGNADQVGKRTGKDQQSGKLTYPGLYGVSQSERMATELIDDACQALNDFGDKSNTLQSMARFILERQR